MASPPDHARRGARRGGARRRLHRLDRTFIYGFHAGHTAFVEPMVTLSYLQSHPEVTAEVKQPQAFEKPGLYPRGYSVRYDPATATFRVALDSLIAR